MRRNRPAIEYRHGLRRCAVRTKDHTMRALQPDPCREPLADGGEVNILVISKLSIPAKDRTLPAWEHLRSIGHRVFVEHPGDVKINTGYNRPDAMISMGVSVMEEAFEAVRRFPDAPLFSYNWDCYSWIWKVPGESQQFHPMRGVEYDYVKYGRLLHLSKEVWVPSHCTGRQTTMWWKVPGSKIARIKSSCPWWDAVEDKCSQCGGNGQQSTPQEGVLIACPRCEGNGRSSIVEDGGYAMCTLRHLPDRCDTWFEEDCQQLKIPFIRSDHNLSREEYERTVARCRFLVCHYDEASTGGLTLLEGYRLGKPVLLSDSPWNGVLDYFGNRGTYFDHKHREDFRAKLLRMHVNPPSPDLKEAKAWIEDSYSDTRMVMEMLARMEGCR